GRSRAARARRALHNVSLSRKRLPLDPAGVRMAASSPMAAHTLTRSKGLTMINSIIRAAPSLAAFAAIALLHAAPAYAVSKVWVSNAGVDGASCGAVTAPCRTFQKAHDNVPAGGEVGVLTPGDYQASNRLMILKSINITNDGSGEA